MGEYPIDRAFLSYVTSLVEDRERREGIETGSELLAREFLAVKGLRLLELP
jgi:hypothetical protein